MNNLLSNVRDLNLNFSVTETPFSIQISIRKTKIKYFENNNYPSIPVENHLNFEPLEKIRALEYENGALIVNLERQKTEIADLKERLEVSTTDNNIIEKINQEFEKQVSMASKNHEEKISENEMLKKSLKVLRDDNSKLRADLNRANKDIKVKEKEIYKLEQKCENLETNNKKAKEDLNKLRKEKKELERDSKIKSKKQTKSNSTNTTEHINSANPSPSSHSLVSSLPTFSPSSCSGPSTSKFSNISNESSHFSPSSPSSSTSMGPSTTTSCVPALEFRNLEIPIRCLSSDASYTCSSSTMPSTSSLFSGSSFTMSSTPSITSSTSIFSNSNPTTPTKLVTSSSDQKSSRCSTEVADILRESLKAVQEIVEKAGTKSGF